MDWTLPAPSSASIWGGPRETSCFALTIRCRYIPMCEACLSRNGLPLGVLSNGTAAMLEAGLKGAAIAQFFRYVLSADSVRKYKIAPEVYQLGPQALGLPANEIAFVSSNAWDAAGATWFSYRVFWVNRQGEPPESLGVLPEYEARSLAELPDWISR